MVARFRGGEKWWQEGVVVSGIGVNQALASVTICSGLHFLMGIPAYLQSEFSLTSAGAKVFGHLSFLLNRCDSGGPARTVLPKFHIRIQLVTDPCQIAGFRGIPSSTHGVRRSSQHSVTADTDIIAMSH
jgi:hypothetical protein